MGREREAARAGEKREKRSKGKGRGRKGGAGLVGLPMFIPCP
jgi:hypothetical protein